MLSTLCMLCFLLLLHQLLHPGSSFTILAAVKFIRLLLTSSKKLASMGARSASVIFIALAVIFLYLPTVLSHCHSPPADAAPTINVDSLFQYTTSRNQKVITQALDFVLSMQTAPTCTRMAASHLMNECKLLEHAPDFAKSRPEAYLDNVKTEYAAKLAVCELLSAQPSNPAPPPYCDILVPSSKACSKGGSWWHPKPETTSDKQCYPEIKVYQYTQCLKSLQSTPQFWTSFSNARQNAVVMCQASRDAIERESHLETFKNLTHILGVVTSSMQKTTEDYESFILNQRQFSEEFRNSHYQLKENIQAVQEKVVTTIEVIDETFHAFMSTSISELIAALAESRNAEIVKIHQRMQDFSQDLMAESSQVVNLFAIELRQFHQTSLNTLRSQQEAQVNSYNVLSKHMDAIYQTVNRTNDIADTSLTKANSMALRLNSLESQTNHIAEGFAFLSAIPSLATHLLRGTAIAIGVMSIFTMLFKIDKMLAIYTAGICNLVFLFYSCGVIEWLKDLLSDSSTFCSERTSGVGSNLSPTQRGASIILLIWVCSYPISCINKQLGRMIVLAFDHFFRPLWIRRYRNEGGQGLLPSIEIPSMDSSGNSSPPTNNGSTSIMPHAYEKHYSTPDEI